MKNTPDFAEREAQLVAEIAAWNATAQIDLAALNQCRQQLRAALASCHRRDYACVLLRQRCSLYRHLYRVSVSNVRRPEFQLANLRCEEPLPF
ncbi:hypothetical protein AMS64_22065 [Aeromonas veronii]|nr:hypothetical protein AMS64_15570 [Aeromonas veronii]AMQ43674.1 hypothetical protein AMS64_15635 [Aeromonas veronii]AMQ44844.1 hypothetical protein AMS64_22065 [Aeromonas veronii]POG17268.1 hypothetical protein C2849_20110 [Aeromonas veronii]